MKKMFSKILKISQICRVTQTPSITLGNRNKFVDVRSYSIGKGNNRTGSPLTKYGGPVDRSQSLFISYLRKKGISS